MSAAVSANGAAAMGLWWLWRTVRLCQLWRERCCAVKARVVAPLHRHWQVTHIHLYSPLDPVLGLRGGERVGSRRMLEGGCGWVSMQYCTDWCCCVHWNVCRILTVFSSPSPAATTARGRVSCSITGAATRPPSRVLRPATTAPLAVGRTALTPITGRAAIAIGRAAARATCAIWTTQGSKIRQGCGDDDRNIYNCSARCDATHLVGSSGQHS